MTGREPLFVSSILDPPARTATGFWLPVNQGGSTLDTGASGSPYFLPLDLPSSSSQPTAVEQRVHETQQLQEHSHRPEARYRNYGYLLDTKGQRIGGGQGYNPLGLSLRQRYWHRSPEPDVQRQRLYQHLPTSERIQILAGPRRREEDRKRELQFIGGGDETLTLIPTDIRPVLRSLVGPGFATEPRPAPRPLVMPNTAWTVRHLKHAWFPPRQTLVGESAGFSSVHTALFRAQRPAGLPDVQQGRRERVPLDESLTLNAAGISTGTHLDMVRVVNLFVTLKGSRARDVRLENVPVDTTWAEVFTRLNNLIPGNAAGGLQTAPVNVLFATPSPFVSMDSVIQFEDDQGASTIGEKNVLFKAIQPPHMGLPAAAGAEEKTPGLWNPRSNQIHLFESDLVFVKLPVGVSIEQAKQFEGFQTVQSVLAEAMQPGEAGEAKHTPVARYPGRIVTAIIYDPASLEGQGAEREINGQTTLRLLRNVSSQPGALVTAGSTEAGPIVLMVRDRVAVPQPPPALWPTDPSPGDFDLAENELVITAFLQRARQQSALRRMQIEEEGAEDATLPRLMNLDPEAHRPELEFERQDRARAALAGRYPRRATNTREFVDAVLREPGTLDEDPGLVLVLRFLVSLAERTLPRTPVEYKRPDRPGAVLPPPRPLSAAGTAQLARAISESEPGDLAGIVRFTAQRATEAQNTFGVTVDVDAAIMPPGGMTYREWRDATAEANVAASDNLARSRQAATAGQAHWYSRKYWTTQHTYFVHRFVYEAEYRRQHPLGRATLNIAQNYAYYMEAAIADQLSAAWQEMVMSRNQVLDNRRVQLIDMLDADFVLHAAFIDFVQFKMHATSRQFQHGTKQTLDTLGERYRQACAKLARAVWVDVAPGQVAEDGFVHLLSKAELLSGWQAGSGGSSSSGGSLRALDGLLAPPGSRTGDVHQLLTRVPEPWTSRA